jgi:hypothetical protein
VLSKSYHLQDEDPRETSNLRHVGNKLSDIGCFCLFSKMEILDLGTCASGVLCSTQAFLTAAQSSSKFELVKTSC